MARRISHRVGLAFLLATALLATGCQAPPGGSGTTTTGSPTTTTTIPPGGVKVRTDIDDDCWAEPEFDLTTDAPRLTEGSTGNLGLAATNVSSGACTFADGHFEVTGYLTIDASSTGANLDGITMWVRTDQQVLPSSAGLASIDDTAPAACPGGVIEGCADTAQPSYGELKLDLPETTTLAAGESVEVGYRLSLPLSAADVAALAQPNWFDVVAAVTSGTTTAVGRGSSIAGPASALHGVIATIERAGSPDIDIDRLDLTIEPGATATIGSAGFMVTAADPDVVEFTASGSAGFSNGWVMGDDSTVEVFVSLPPRATVQRGTVEPETLVCSQAGQRLYATVTPDEASAATYSHYAATLIGADANVTSPMFDDGVAPDVAADGTYTATLDPPLIDCDLAVPVQVSVSGFAGSDPAATVMWHQQVTVGQPADPRESALSPTSTWVRGPNGEQLSSTRLTFRLADTANSRAARAAATAVGGHLAGSFTLDSTVWQIDLDAPGTFAQVTSARDLLAAQPGVTGAENSSLVTGSSTVRPNDADGQDYLDQISAAKTWTYNHGVAQSRDQVVAVVDSGVDQVADLQGKIVLTAPATTPDPDHPKDRYFLDLVDGDNVPDDGDGHGTFIAGEIAANPNDGRGVSGVLWGGRVLPIRVLDNNAKGSSDVVANGVRVALRNPNVRVINLSLGERDPKQTLAEALSMAADRRVVTVAAAGNCGTDGPFYPAGFQRSEPGPNGTTVHPDVISVGNIDGQNRPYRTATLNRCDNQPDGGSTNYGPNADMAAPGTDISGLARDGGTESRTGTSMAAPLVAAGAAMILSTEPSISLDDVRARLTMTGQAVQQRDFAMPVGRRLSLFGATMNPSFETRSLSGWNLSGHVAASGAVGSVRPASGTTMAMLTADEGGSATLRRPFRLYSQALQGETVTISVRYNFLTEHGASPPSTSNDRFNIAVIDDDGGFHYLAEGRITDLALRSAPGVDLPGGPNGPTLQTGWKTASISLRPSQVPAGSSLRFYVTDAGDAARTSALLIDQVSIS